MIAFVSLACGFIAIKMHRIYNHNYESDSVVSDGEDVEHREKMRKALDGRKAFKFS